MLKGRVVVIGLDGATFDLLRPWAEAGFLPNLAKLLETGCSGPLRSTIQPTTAPAWTTFLTGVNQGKHGLFDFVARRQDGYNLEVTSSAHVKAASIFDYAGQQGLKVLGLNIPYTAPARPVNGVLIGGPFAPTVTPDLFFPQEYYDKIMRLVPGYFVLPDYDGRAVDPLADYAHKLSVGIANREKIALHLLQHEPWDLFMMVFMESDEVQHTFWHCLDAPEASSDFRYRHTILQVYQRLDEAIGRLLAAATAVSPDTPLSTFIVSDHGAGPFAWMINLNRWLADAGFLHFRQDSTSALQQQKARLLKQLALGYRRYIPGKLRAAMRARLGVARFEQVKGGFESALLTSNVAWEQTRAYALGAGGNIYVNLKGREPTGIVEPGADYERVRQELIAHLMTMRDPDSGQPVVKQAHLREALYSGSFLEQAPDVVIEWSDYAYWGRGQYESQSAAFEKQRHFDFSDQPLTGSHRPEGILIANGPGMQHGAEVEGASLLDLAPTLLGILGIKSPADMDGRFLSELFTKEYADQLLAILEQSDPVAPITPTDHQYTSEEEALIAAHLRALGYL